MMKKQSINYPKNSPQAQINRNKITLFEQGWNESDAIYIDRLRKMLQDSQGYIDKLHKTVFDKNKRINEMQDHIYFLEDELNAVVQNENEQEFSPMVFDEAV